MTTTTVDFDKVIKKEKFYYVNSDITAANFPVISTEIENWKLIRPGKRFTSQEAIDMMKAEGCRPATAYELLLWKQLHGDELKDWEYCLAFGQTYTDSDGDHRVPRVYRGSDGDWRFYLGYFGRDWGGDYCLLCFEEISTKIIKLLHGEETLVDTEDYEELNQYKWSLSSHGYASRPITVDGKKTSVSMHRQINKTPDGFQTDHINRNRLDNRKENLRTVTWSENQLNTGLRTDNTSGEKGISKKGNKWQVHLRRDKKRYFLGNFDTMKEAVIVRDSFDTKPSVSLAPENDVETLTLEPCTVETAITMLKKHGFKITKEELVIKEY